MKILKATSVTEKVQLDLKQAVNILSNKAGKKDGLYANIRYVKMAARIAYSAALIILDEFLVQKEGAHSDEPQDYEEYFARIQKHDKKLLILLVDVHARLHIVGYLYGTRSVTTLRLGLKDVTKMLKYISA
jgi:ABC-type branched-subunit amino acid transport system ATPase component